MASRPNSVKIGPVIYTILWDRVLTDDCWGETDPRTLEIRITGGLEPSQQKKTLLHEIMHGCAGESTGKMEPKITSHQMIYALEAPLFGVFQENPDLVKWLSAT